MSTPFATLVDLTFFGDDHFQPVMRGGDLGSKSIKMLHAADLITKPSEAQAFLTAFAAFGCGVIASTVNDNPKATDKAEDFKRQLSELIMNLQRVEMQLMEGTITADGFNPSRGG